MNKTTVTSHKTKIVPLPERITFSLPVGASEKLRQIALTECRSLSSLMLLIVQNYLESKESEK